MDLTKFTWTREPKQYTVNEDTIEITTNPIQIYGREPITISGTTMRLFSRWRQVKNISALW